MALASFFDRAALAASQVVAGFDPNTFRDQLEQLSVAVAISEDAASSAEGRHLADMSVRLLARLYPNLDIETSAATATLGGELQDLARSINPQIGFERRRDALLHIGDDIATTDVPTVYLGSDGFDAHVSTTRPRTIGASSNPFGAGAAACLGAGMIFRALLFHESIQEEIVFSTLSGEREPTDAPLTDAVAFDEEIVLIGVGAVGNAAVWALERSQLRGVLHVVDDETVESSNLQRYVLAGDDDIGTEKVALVHARPGLDVQPHQASFEEFAALRHQQIPFALVALDSAEGRWRVQASLPGAIVNAWTQPGDLGVSRHGPFGTSAACLSCLYLPEGETRNEDQLVAEALALTPQLMEVRRLLFTNEPIERPLLELISASLGVDLELLLPFEGRPLRSLYTEGICGGAVIPMGQLGQPRQEVHVPLAHQSALAGVLLAAAVIRRGHEAAKEMAPLTTQITRINVLQPLATELTQPAAVAGRGICLCEDEDYRAIFASKWDGEPAPRT
jgi:hypothetical protein